MRLVDKAYLYADSGIQANTLEKLGNHSGYWADVQGLWSRVFSSNGGLTESGESVYAHIGDRLLPTIQLALFAVAFGLIFAVVFSLETLEYPRVQAILDFVSKLILSTPVFIFAILLLLVFFYRWEILPPGGYEWGNLAYLILPGLSLGVRVYARLQIFLSQEAKSEWQSPFFVLLQARGLPRRVVVYKNLLVKLFPTILVLVILDLGSLLSGAMVVEEIFFYPGIGRSLYYAIKSMDRDLLQIMLLYSGVVFYTMNRSALLFQNQILNNWGGRTE